MATSKSYIVSLFILYLAARATCKIVLPQNLRYLENMLNSEAIAKVAEIQHYIEENPNLQDKDKNWPMLLAKNQFQKKQPARASAIYPYRNIFGRRKTNI